MVELQRNNYQLMRLAPSEIWAIVLLALAFGFALTLHYWFDASVTVAEAITDFLFVTIAMLIAVLLHEGGHKFAGARLGYESLIQPNYGGLVISLFVSLYTFGAVPFITPNLINLDARPDVRIGYFYRYDNPKHAARVAAGGIIGSTIAMTLFTTLFQLTHNPLYEMIILGCAIHGIASMLPFELLSLLQLRFFSKGERIVPGDGLHMWWASVQTWLFMLFFIVTFSILAMTAHVIAYVTSLLIAVVATYAFVKWVLR